MQKTTLPLLLGVLASAGSALAALQVDFGSSSSVKAAAKDLAFDLMSYYKGNQSGGIPGLLNPTPPEGRYDWSTNALVWSTMIDYWHYTGDDTYNNVTVEGLMWQSGPSLKQPFLPPNYTAGMGNEDQGLWGMAAMQAAEVGFPSPPDGDPSWIELAKAVFDTQAARYSAEEACGGGLRMALAPTSALYDSKDTAATAVFLGLGARLYRFTNNETYAEWAERSWNWLTGVGLVDDDFNVWDVSHDGAKGNCSHVTKLRWSSPAAVLIQAAAYMTSQTPNTTTAHQTWQTRLTSLTARTTSYFFARGPLSEPLCESSSARKTTSCDTRRVFFKGIAVRALSYAAALVPAFRQPDHAVARGLRASAEGAARACDGGEGERECGFGWTEGDSVGGGGVPMVLNALAAVMAPLVGEAGELGRASGGEGGEDGNGGGEGAGSGGNGGGEGGEGGNGDDGDGTEGGNGAGDGESAGASTTVTMGLVLAGLVAALL